MNDLIEQIGESIIQHGKFNDRIYLLKLKESDFPNIINKLSEISEKKGYTKIFVKARASFMPAFITENYQQEAFIPRFYNGKDDVVFLSKFLDQNRKKIPAEQLLKLQNVISQEVTADNKGLNPKFNFRKATEHDANNMANLYKKVFATYPFPIHDPEYLKETMKTHIDYFGIWHGEKLIGLSSSEFDHEFENAEMTDFAVLPDYRGNQLAYFLLIMMEKELAKTNIKTLYTIARLNSIGMNVTFQKCGYKFSGTLINNTNISGGLESMNIWYKNL